MTARWSAWSATLALPKSVTLRHHSIEQRQVLLLCYQSANETLWTEAAPLPGWSCDTVVDNRAALPQIQGLTPQQALSVDLPPALSTAVGLLTLPNCARREPAVESNLLLLEDDDILGETVINVGKRCYKVKVGRLPIDVDIARIQSLLAQSCEHICFRLDANQSWTYEDIHKLDVALGDEPRIAYVEEPLRPELSYQLWPSVTRLAFAHDERLRQPDFKPDPHCSALVIKPTLLGWSRTQDCNQIARQQGCSQVLSSSFESLVGLNLLNNLARHWQLSTVQGLATADFFQQQWHTPDAENPLPIAPVFDVEQVL
ncbi:o-succinylbenzoate synthase [Reinekea sp. G2M2-21]|uniref:o-succinylbenzoate synthase n=1 Tax=Reinekea sp. G2M2-21 TaxID=2788942 RepID=UPI0018ABF12D|nr:o-succinylbenzoate synthase [Reinekea sp. G2M2-21]